MPATLQSKEMQSLESIAEGSNKFAIDLYKSLKDTAGNIVVSPICAQIALALAYTGANGTTADEMAKTLHLPSNKELVLEGHKALITSLEDPVLKIATRIFVSQSFHLKPEFQSLATAYFFSGLEGKDFENNADQSRREINSWVEEKTNSKIKNLLGEGSVSSSTRLILVNAIHFKAKWATPFAASLTEKAPFHISKDETIQVDMMHLHNKRFKYTHSSALGAKILEMPYEGNNFSMIVILPDEIDGLPLVESKLAENGLTNELLQLQETLCNVKMPKFKIEATMQLKDNLKKMGMVSAFTDGANFSGLSEEPVAIDAVIQKAFIEVNEEGTEAAAATAVVMKLRCCIDPENLVADHPFIVLITHQSNKAMPIFIAAVKLL